LNDSVEIAGRAGFDSAQPGRYDGPSRREKVADLLQQEKGINSFMAHPDLSLIGSSKLATRPHLKLAP